MPKSSQRHFLIKVAGIDGYFATKSGGESTSPSNKVYDGGKITPEVVTGPIEVADLVCGRSYDAAIDAPILKALRPQVGSYTTTVSVTPTDRNMVPVSAPTTYANAILTGLTEPDADASSSDAAAYELTFTVSSAV